MNSFMMKRKGLYGALFLLIIALILFYPVIAYASEGDTDISVSSSESTSQSTSDAVTSGSESSAPPSDSVDSSPAPAIDSVGSSPAPAEGSDDSSPAPSVGSDDSSPAPAIDSVDSSPAPAEGSGDAEGDGISSGDAAPDPTSGDAALMSEASSPGTEGEGEKEPGDTENQDEPDTTRTVSDYEIPAGSAYIAGADETVYENSAEANAINQAIQAALASAQKSITIVVNDGVYAGGITAIGNAAASTAGDPDSESESADNSILIQIIAHDALVTNDDGSETITYSANAGSAGGVRVEGDLNFSDIQVLLAGIYLSLQNKVTVTNAKTVEYYGTAADDTVNLELNNVSDSVTVDLGAGNDKLNASISQSPTITIDLSAGGSAIFSSLAGNIGRDSRPFRTTVDRITAMADYIYLDNSKSLTVDEVIGSTVNVKADGDILSGNAGSGNDDNDIIAENLNMIGGDIGVSGGAVKIQAGKLSSNSNNLNVRSDDNIVIGEIRAGNNVELSAGGTISAHQSANTAINAGNLALQSVGSIGGDGASMNVRVSGTTTGDVQYGYAYLTNKYQAPSHNRRGGSGGGGGAEITIKDQSTGIIISGELSGELVVTDIRQALQDDSVVSRIIEKLGLEKVLKAYKIQITGSVSGAVTVTIPVERQYNGKTITVIYEQSGKMFATNVTVENDSVSMEVELPGDFIVLDDIYPVKFVDLKTSEFEDVALTDWFFEGVAYAYGMNLMNGTDGNEFSPQESLTRAMLAVILFRLEGRPGPKDGHAPANWYEDGMNWAISSGIIMNDVPGEQITREQFIMMLYRYAAMKGWKLDYDYDLSSFGDAGNVSDYTMDAMKWAISIGLVKGRDDHNLAPGDNLTRAETATLLKRFTDLFPTGMLVIREN